MLTFGVWGCAAEPTAAPEGAPGGAAGSAGAPSGGSAGAGAPGVMTGHAGASGAAPLGGAPGAGSASAVAGAAGNELGSAGAAGSSTNGGAAGSAGQNAASGNGGAGSGPSSGCVGSKLALCEDFESGKLDANVWKLTQKKGTVTLDTARVAPGSKFSAHVHVDAGSDTTVGLVESKTFPALKAGLFARARIYIPNASTASLFMGDRHSRLIYAQGASPYGEYALGIWNGGLIQNHYSKTDDSQDTKMLPPFDQWFCLEYELDSAAGNVKAYLDGAEITALRHQGWPASNIDTLMFGVDRFGSFPVAEDIWFDDLAVDSARIGCNTP